MNKFLKALSTISPTALAELDAIHKGIDKGKDAEGEVVGMLAGQGMVWNPLNGYPRNANCFCQSGKKFKKCCDGKIPRNMPEKVALRIKLATPQFLSGEHWLRFVVDQQSDKADIQTSIKGLFSGLPNSEEHEEKK